MGNEPAILNTVSQGEPQLSTHVGSLYVKTFRYFYCVILSYAITLFGKWEHMKNSCTFFHIKNIKIYFPSRGTVEEMRHFAARRQ